MENYNYQISNFNFRIIRVLIVDDHRVVAEGFENLINESGIAGVIGKAYSAAGCMELLAKSKTDVLLLDISLPDCNGIDLFLQVKEQYPDLKVIILTSHYELPIIKRALDCGVSGYILKNSSAAVIIEGIRTVMSSEQFLCPETQRLIQQCDHQIPLLSRREKELLRLIVEGKSTVEIAESMSLGYETIKSYRKRIMLKLKTVNTADLVRIALEQNLI